MENNNRLFFLDAYALIFRSFYAFIRNPRYNSKGLNTSAIFGFTNSLVEILQKEQPGHIAVVFDPDTPTFRNEIFPDYKANREETPEDIKKSVPYIKRIIEAFKIPIIQIDNYEADDVIGTLARKAEKEGYITYMVTPDKDYGQLVSDKVFIYKPKRAGNDIEILGKDEICEKYKIKTPEQLIDIMGLWGDTSDNVPGVPGIGEKTAIKLISEFDSLENLYDNLDKLKGKLKEKLEDNKQQAFLSKKLVAIAIKIPYSPDWEQLRMAEPDHDQLAKLFQDLEFKGLKERIFPDQYQAKASAYQQGDLFAEGGDISGGRPIAGDSDVQKTATIRSSEDGLAEDQTISERKELKNIDNTAHSYQLVNDVNAMKMLADKISGKGECCFDTETTSVDPMKAELVGLALCFQKGEAYYVPVTESKEEALDVMENFREVFENEKVLKIGQNLNYDIQVLKNYDMAVKGPLFDTMIAHYLLHPELRHNMTFISEQYLNYTPVSIESLIGKKGKDQKSMRSVDMETQKEYAGEDADVTFQLKEKLVQALKENGLYPLYETIEMPLVRVLVEMENTGVRIDKDALQQYGEKLKSEMNELEEKIIGYAGQRFNVGSPKQLGEVLFDKMKIDQDAKRTKSKQYSTSEETLMKLKDKHPVIPLILEYRSVKKLLSGYIEALPKLVHPGTGRIHTSFNQTIAATGRLSSTNPNLQNIPIREERGREIRKAFVTLDEKSVLLAADYSQIELRLMAHLSEDEGLIEAFKQNEDIHTSTAAKIHHISNDEVTRDMRSQAKTANFGIIYGISAFGLSQRLNISRSEARQLIDSYFSSYPKVKQYMDQSIQTARDKGYVETFMGRRRYLPDINSRNNTVRGMAERNAINAPIQGSAADIIKKAMIEIDQQIRKSSMQTKMLLQVHDELVFNVPEAELETVSEMVKRLMENTISLKVPMLVELGTGKNWLEAH